MARMSKPSRTKLSSLAPISMISSRFWGQLKRCFSSLFCQRQKPLRSQYNIFSILRPRLQNTKRWPENGSRRRVYSTRIDRLFIALRISVLPGARKTRTLAGKYIISAPACGRHARGLRDRILCRSRCGSVGQRQGKAADRMVAQTGADLKSGNSTRAGALLRPVFLFQYWKPFKLILFLWQYSTWLSSVAFH